MLDEQVGDKDFANRYIEGMLEGKTPQGFIKDAVEGLRGAASADQIEQQGQAEGIGSGDIAYIVQFWVDQGVVRVEDISDTTFLESLGLSPQEAQVFIPETLPAMQEFMKQERLKEIEERETRNREYAGQFVKNWNLERLDEIVNHYLNNQKKLDKTDRYWVDNIRRYQNQREKLGKEFQEITDPFLQAQFLMRQAYYLIYLHPSELQQIFNAERETKTYPYLDSLLHTSVVMSQNTSGKDPDFHNVHMSSGNIGMTVSFFSVDDEESMKRLRREQALETLIFGAQKTNETRALWKKQITPLAKGKPVDQRRT